MGVERRAWTATTAPVALLALLDIVVGDGHDLAWTVPIGAVTGVVGGVYLHNGGSGRALLRGEVGVANGLTLLRGATLAVLAVFLVVEPGTAWVPAGLYAAAALLDRLDGVVARRVGEVTALGGALDRECDAVGLAVGPLVAATLGLGPAWFAAVGLVRVPHLAHLTVRRRRGRPVADLPPSRLRRPLAGAAMVTTVLLLVPVVGPTVGEWLAVAVGVPFLLRYVVDWLAVLGVGPAAGGTSTGPDPETATVSSAEGEP